REFEEAYRLFQRPEFLYNIGKAYDGVGDHARAILAYRRFVAQAPQSRDRAQVQTRITALEHLVGRLRIIATAAGATQDSATLEGATVRLDDKEVGQTPIAAPLEVNPGAHKVEVVKEGYRTFRRSVVAAPNEETAAHAELESLVRVVKQLVEV